MCGAGIQVMALQQWRQSMRSEWHQINDTPPKTFDEMTENMIRQVNLEIDIQTLTGLIFGLEDY